MNSGRRFPPCRSSSAKCAAIAPTPEQQDNLDILNEQVRNCKRILDSLLAHAQETSSELSLEEFIRNVLDEWQLLRPTVHYRFHVKGLQPSPRLRADLALRSALLNLLNNAADASPDEMDILLFWNRRKYQAGNTRPGSRPDTRNCRARRLGLLHHQTGRPRPRACFSPTPRWKDWAAACACPTAKGAAQLPR